jgi:hypothetical protein
MKKHKKLSEKIHQGINKKTGGAIAQAVSRWLATAAAGVQIRI